jgi:hypothetical protein
LARTPDSGRLANVSVAVIAAGATADDPRARSAVDGLAALFDEIVWVGGAPPSGSAARPVPELGGLPGPLRDWIDALTATRCERQLLVDLDLALAPEVLLALIAWPEAEALVPERDRGAARPRALLRRIPALERAQALRAQPAAQLSELLASLETVFVPNRVLWPAAVQSAEAPQ